MITIENMMLIDKVDLLNTSKMLNKEDIAQLVEWLSLKDDKIRYQAFQLLQNRSMFVNDIYTYWEIFRYKLKSDNSYQRSIGLMLIAENVKWDTEGNIVETIDEYLELLNDEKPIIIRQCIQSIDKIVQYKPELNNKIAEKLITVNTMSIKETMRKSILLDILNILLLIRNNLHLDDIENYIQNALTGEILDKKAKKQLKSVIDMDMMDSSL